MEPCGRGGATGGLCGTVRGMTDPGSTDDEGHGPFVSIGVLREEQRKSRNLVKCDS